MEALRIYKLNNRNSDILLVSYLGLLRIHNRYAQAEKRQRHSKLTMKMEY